MGCLSINIGLEPTLDAHAYRSPRGVTGDEPRHGVDPVPAPIGSEESTDEGGEGGKGCLALVTKLESEKGAREQKETNRSLNLSISWDLTGWMPCMRSSCLVGRSKEKDANPRAVIRHMQSFLLTFSIE
ncbi:hypothetical protein L249_3955 [Ophiocordyceps polyrhachis-furcata BCC 54312]|uniref:Uncharacterized protein n=1 Tax=Ophiocordyceps polyrhachis-furcata BCC 54312 TaxID=1330021 RepID=A0A367L5P3_9HYPO|nr:hypothetical protein L249_3955 [Ophiocordyceps polyrhachis-furcata BCC 54312]